MLPTLTLHTLPTLLTRVADLSSAELLRIGNGGRRGRQALGGPHERDEHDGTEEHEDGEEQALHPPTRWILSRFDDAPTGTPIVSTISSPGFTMPAASSRASASAIMPSVSSRRSEMSGSTPQ